jgi:hypothetical protein
MAAIDQGILDFMNFAVPGCSANQDYARVAKQTGILKSVPLGQQCPAGYNPAPNNGSDGFPINTMNTICGRNTPPTPAELSVLAPAINSLATCVSRSPSAPARPLVCEYCKCPPGSGRVDLGCPPRITACPVCPVAFTPGTPITPSQAPTQAPVLAPSPILTPAPGPGPVQSELPMWAIVLIVIVVIMFVGGAGSAMFMLYGQ